MINFNIVLVLISDSDNILIVGKERYISPVTGPTCPEGFKKLRFLEYVTMAQDGGKVISLTYRPLFTPRKYSWSSFLLGKAVSQ